MVTMRTPSPPGQEQDEGQNPLRPINPSDIPPLRTFVVRLFKDGDHTRIEELTIEAHAVHVLDRVLTAIIEVADYNPRTGETQILVYVRWIFNAETWLDVREVVFGPTVITH